MITLIIITKIFFGFFQEYMFFFFPFKTDVYADIIFRFYKVQVEECFWCFFFSSSVFLRIE